MSLPEIIRKIIGSRSDESDQLVQALGMQNLMGEIQMANSLTSRITNKLVSDVIDEVFSVKRRHKVLHV